MWALGALVCGTDVIPLIDGRIHMYGVDGWILYGFGIGWPSFEIDTEDRGAV